MADEASATALGGPGQSGYFGSPTIRSRPVSVTWQIANALCPIFPNHS